MKRYKKALPTTLQIVFVWCCLIGNIAAIIYIVWLMVQTIRSLHG